MSDEKVKQEQPKPVEITINLFIPQNNVANPLSYWPDTNVDPSDPWSKAAAVSEASAQRVTVFEGDNRVNAKGEVIWDKDGSHRTQQKFFATPFETNLDQNRNGLADHNPHSTNGEVLNDVNFSREYDKNTAVDENGNLTDEARADTQLNDDKYKIGEGHETNENMYVRPERINENVVIYHCHGSAGNPLVLGAPKADYDFAITVDYTDPKNPKASITGTHDGFPAYEVYINNVQIHKHDPIETKQTVWSLAGDKEWRVPAKEIPITP